MLTLQIFISTISDTEVVLGLLLLLSCYLYFKGFTKDMYKVLASSVLATCITYFLKHITNIPRPTDMLVLETSSRFPSGHATMAGVVCALVIYYSYTKIHRKNFRYLSYSLAPIWLISVSYSRIYLKAHYLVDVLVGGFIGVFATIIIIYIFQYIHYYKK